jgi:hypothetical protein
MFLNPQPESVTSADSLSADRADAGVYEIHATNATSRLEQFISYAGFAGGRLLLIGGDEFLQNEAIRRGFDVISLSASQVECGALDQMPDGRCQGCILYCALERLSDPAAALSAIRDRLEPGGSLMVIAPTIDSRTARLFRSSWWEFCRTTRYYFTADTLQNLLVKTGYGDPIITRDDSVVSLNYMRRKLAALPLKLRYRLLRLVLSLSPGFLRHRAFRFLHSRIAVLVRPKTVAAVPRLSVIVPVYNEKATFTQLIEVLLRKEIEGVDIEVIIVESNSADGTRELVMRYQDHPRVRIILEDRPRGKGHAVRTGLAAATGDIVLFQDADLEYDIDDYDGLIKPILTYQQNFVIGSRHTVNTRVWKIRKFNEAGGLAAIFNFGHMAFLGLFNLIYQQRLMDPFSMFKVFRRDCLYGLTFECNRFDFDFEIVIKLLRKGYRALELPVNYKARSFREGKKVTMIRDPLTWLRALVTYRASRLYAEMQTSDRPKA